MRLQRFLLPALGWSLAACTSAIGGSEPKTFEVPPPPPLEPYYVMPGDALDVRYAYHPEYNIQAQIRPDGRVSVPFAEEVLAAGKTVPELDEMLTQSVAKHLRDPELVVVVREFAQQQVFVSGEVREPGLMTLTSGLTAFQAITARGGLLTSAAEDSVVLIRAVAPGRREVRRVNLSGEGLVTNDLALRPFDVVFVPRTGIADVGLFVDQYINALIPRSLSFGLYYQVNDFVVR